MNFEITKQILEKLEPYVDIINLDIETSVFDWRGQKYKSDFVLLNQEHNVGFQVYEREVVVFCFGEHQHFNNYTEDETDLDYIAWAIEFLENLFTLPTKRIQKYKGKELVSEKYSFIKNGKEDCFSGLISHRLLFYNPFAKKTYKKTILRYDVDAKTFVNEPLLEDN